MLEEEFEDFEDRIDEVSRLIEGLKDGSLPADYVDKREGEIYAREQKKAEEKEKKEKEEEKISHMCESIGHRPLRGRCPKSEVL